MFEIYKINLSNSTSGAYFCFSHRNERVMKFLGKNQLPRELKLYVYLNVNIGF